MTTFKHSIQKKESTISSVGAGLAKISQLQVSNLDSKGLEAHYFTSAFGYLNKFDLNSPSLKTLEICFPLKKGGYSKKFSSKLPKQGMCVNGQLFQQEMWEGVTYEKEFGSYVTLATPNCMDYLPPRGLDSMIKQTQVHRKGRTKLANLREQLDPQAV